MNKLKKQDGIISVILMLLVCFIVVVGLFFILDIYGFVDVPEEYSITRFLNSSNEVVYQADTNTSNNKKTKKKVKDEKNYSNAEFVNTESVFDKNNSYEENDNREDYAQEDYNRFYYSQLDNNAKIIYDGIVDNRDNLKSGTYTIDFGKEFNKLLNSENGADILNNSFQSAVNAVLLDNPDIFFLDITKMYLFTHSTTYPFTGTTYEVSISANEGDSYLNKSFYDSDIDVAESKILNIKRSISNWLEGNDVDKIKQIHDYLVDNLEYDSTFSNPNIYNLYGAIVNNSTVCEGYAKAFKYLLDSEGIPCIVVCGIAQNSKGEIENHAWNDVLIDGKWYAVDVTWDDPIVVGGGRLSNESKYKYYLRGAEALFKDHEEDGNVVEGVYFDYPELSIEDY